MALFPTLSVPPTEIEQTIEDATIRSEFEAGYEITRNQFTRNRSTFDVTYKNLQRVDKDLLIVFLKTVYGSAVFTWENHDEELSPDVYQTYEVRFSQFPTIPADAKKYGLYDITFQVREI